MLMKNSNDTTGNRTRDLLTCSVVPQPTAPTYRICINEHSQRLCLSTWLSLEQLYSLRRHVDRAARENGGIQGQDIRAILEVLQKYPFTLKQNRIVNRYQFVKQYKVFIPTRENCGMLSKIGNPNVGIWYTDGSGICQRL